MLPTREKAIHSERFLRVICIGAGPSGLCFAYKLQRSFRKFSLTVRLHTHLHKLAEILKVFVPLDI